MHRHELGRAVPRWLVVGALCTAVLAAPAASPRAAGAAGAVRPGVTQVDPPPVIDNGIFRVQVDGGASLGAISVTTGADHPAGPDLPVLSQPGRPGSSFFTVHSYDTGTDYTQREMAGVVNLAPSGTVTPLGEDGLRVTYEITEPDQLQVVQDLTIGGTTLDDTFVAVETTVMNTGDQEVRVGLRRLWDLHLLTNARPETILDLDPDFGDPPFERSVSHPGGDTWSAHSALHGLAIAGSVAGGPYAGSPLPSPPDLLQYVNRSSVLTAPFGHTISAPALAISRDSTLLAFWGDTLARSRPIAPGGQTTVTTLFHDHEPQGGVPNPPRGRPLPIHRRPRSRSADPVEQTAVAPPSVVFATDTAGDTPYPGGDIIDWRARIMPGTGGRPFLRIRARTQEGVDPVWSYPWRFGKETSMQAALDVNGQGADFNIRLWDFQGVLLGPVYGLRAEVFRSGASGRYLCSGRPYFDGAATYGFDIPLSCLGDPGRVRAWVATSFQPEPFLRDPPTGIDVSPETGWSPWLATD